MTLSHVTTPTHVQAWGSQATYLMASGKCNLDNKTDLCIRADVDTQYLTKKNNICSKNAVYL